MTAALVAVAGAAGVLARYGIGRATLHTEALLWSTLAINLAGSLVDGGKAGTALAYLTVSVIGGRACAAAVYALGRELA